MGVLEIAVAAIFLIAGTVGGSAVAGALLGRSRDLGAARGFGWGLLLPVIGLGRVLASPKKEQPVADQNKDAPAAIEQRQTDDIKKSARQAARERFRKDNSRTEAPAKRVVNGNALESNQEEMYFARKR